MSSQTTEPGDPVPGHSQLKMTVEVDAQDLGGFSVRRLLPSAQCRKVGPFVFFDYMEPAEFPPGEGIAVRPHPHIGLSTVTYLFAGEIVHRDSLGYVQPIRAEAVNLMTAGRGIVHSERAGDDLQTTSQLHGIQSWMALPDELEECDPDFNHYPADSLPEFEIDGARVKIIIGEAGGKESPVKQYLPTLYLECHLKAGSGFELPQEYDELAVFPLSGDVSVAGESVKPGQLGVLQPKAPAAVEAASDAHFMVLGGSSVGRRYVWWNFVSSSRDRIEQAKDDWRQNRFATIPGESEFIPLPGEEEGP